MLQCVSVCCSVLQCVAVYSSSNVHVNCDVLPQTYYKPRASAVSQIIFIYSKHTFETGSSVDRVRASEMHVALKDIPNTKLYEFICMDIYT